MALLDEQEVSSWGAPKVRETMKAELGEVQSIKSANGGSLANVSTEDAEKIREHNGNLEVLGKRLDVARELEGADELFSRYDDFLNGVDPEQAHPGHGKTVELPIASLWPNYAGIGEVPADGFALRATLFDSTAYPIQPDFIAQPVETLYQPNNIGPRFAQGTTNSNTVRYPVETVTSTGAAEINEGASKPEAQLSFAPVDEPIRKIAVLLPLTDESLDDVPFLRSYINARLRLFVQMREDLQLLAGSGTAPNLRGILNRSGINTTASYSIGGANPDQALIDQTFVAIMGVLTAFLEPDTIVMKPSTWQIARLAKDAQRNYLLGRPADEADRRLWGYPVILNANMPAQSATNKVVLVGAFRSAAMLIRRSGIDLAVSDSHSTFFAENKVAIRAEERIGLAVFRPAGFATVTSAA